MLTGTIFDVREFTVHDGPGIRTTVFMKGCGLRCSWCHNPEGLSPFPQVMKGSAGERLVGQTFTSRELATRLNQQARLLKIAEGGVTFSGGEPLMQSAFVAEVIDQLNELHVTLDSCGNAAAEEFMRVVSRCDLVLLDLKLADPQEHLRWTGCDNRLILHNLGLLAATDIPFIIRVPLIPGVTDTDQNLLGIARVLAALPRHPGVELLPYNQGARAKYAACGMEWRPGFDENIPYRVNLEPFKEFQLQASLA
jgi:pyruvate formate lyase activating enzyme